jgi:hypothetical protein
MVHEERIGVGRAYEIMTLDHVLPAVQREPVREKLSYVRAKIVTFKPVRQPRNRPPGAGLAELAKVSVNV